MFEDSDLGRAFQEVRESFFSLGAPLKSFLEVLMAEEREAYLGAGPPQRRTNRHDWANGYYLRDPGVEGV